VAAIGPARNRASETDRCRRFVRGYTFEPSGGQGTVMAAVHGMQTGRLPWGAEHHRAFRKLFCHRTGMVAICEDLPEKHNTVTLDPLLKDANGTPGPKITYQQPAYAGPRCRAR
jgi:hypothetical protein